MPPCTPSLIVAERWDGHGASETPGEILAASHRRGCGPLCWRLPRRTLAFDGSPGSPWIMVPSDVRGAFERVRAAGIALADSAIGRPHLGVKCGFNLAFVVTSVEGGTDDVASIVASNGRRGSVERGLLRPAVRGEGVHPWRTPEVGGHLIWTHGPSGAPLERLPTHATRWLTPWRQQLAARADARGARWWTLFRVEAARCDRPRVLWADLGRAPRATMVPAGDPIIPLNSCYVTLCREEQDALALVAILNSPLADAWLAALAEPARGGYHRFLGWTMSLLPLPRDWLRARDILAPLAVEVMGRDQELQRIGPELLDACLAAYRVRHHDVEPLLTWFTG